MLEDVHAQVDFETAVGQDTDVFQAARKARRRRGRTVPDQVVRTAVIVVDRTVKTVPQAEIDTQVDLVVALPRKIAVTRAGLRNADLAVGFPDRPEVGVGIRSRKLVAGHTVVDAQFQFVDPRSVVHEALALDTPCGAHRPEVAPLVVLEARRSVVAVRTREEILAGVVIVHTCEIAFDGGHHGARGRAVAILRNGVAQFGDARVENIFLVGVHDTLVGLAELVADQYVEVVVLLDGLVPVEHLLGVVREIVVVVLLDKTVVGRRGSRTVFIVIIEGIHPVHVVQREVGRKLEILQEYDLAVEIGVEVVANRVVDIAAHRLHGVREVVERVELILRCTVGRKGRAVALLVHLRAVGIVTDVTVQVAGVVRHGGVLPHRPQEHVARVGPRIAGAVNIAAGIRKVRPDLQPFGGLCIEGGATRVTLESRHDYIRGVFEEAARNVVVHLVVAAADAQRVFLTELLGEQVVVVVVGIKQFRVGIELARGGVDQRRTVGNLIGHVVSEHGHEVGVRSIGKRSMARPRIIRLKVVIKPAVYIFVIVAGVLHGLMLFDTLLVPTPLGFEHDVGLLVARSLLRGDENHAVCGTRTVQRIGSGILRHDDRLDIERVDRRKRRRIRHAVDDDQCGLGSVDRTDTADDDRSVVTGLSRRTVRLHTGNGAFQHSRSGSNGGL